MTKLCQRREQGIGNVSNSLMLEAVNRISGQRHEAAVQSVQMMIEEQAKKLSIAVVELRNVREVERTLATKIKKIDRAFRYFKETGIPFPLLMAHNPKANKGDKTAITFCHSVGIDVPDEESHLWEIPENFVPSV